MTLNLIEIKQMMLKDMRGEINTSKSPFDLDYSEELHVALSDHLKNSSDEENYEEVS